MSRTDLPEVLAGLQKLVPLDDDRYNLDENDHAFFKSQTGIQDDAVLKQHIIKVQNDAYKVGRLLLLCRYSHGSCAVDLTAEPSFLDFPIPMCLPLFICQVRVKMNSIFY